MNNELLVYTTEEGGDLQARWGTREQYEKAVETGVLEIPNVSKDEAFERIPLAFIVLAPADENHDFIMGTNRLAFVA